MFLQILAFAPNVLWWIGSWHIGNKRRVGFVFSFCGEILWVWVSIAAHLWTLLPWCAVGMGVFVRNWWKWRPSEGS